MSDHSNSTGSTGSSTNSWTLLSPEEVAIENIGHGDDGTESLGDVPSLAEELSGATPEIKQAEVPVETVLSEEGHEVCQETSPESSEGPVPSSPARMSSPAVSPLELSELDLESQPPVIHDIVTSSPSDNEHVSAMTFVTNIELRPHHNIPPVEIPSLDSSHSKEAVIDSTAQESPSFSATSDVKLPTETLTAAHNLSHTQTDSKAAPASLESHSPVSEHVAIGDFEGCTGAEEVEPPLEEELSSEEELSNEADGVSVPAGIESHSPVSEDAAIEDFEGCTGAEEPESPAEEELSSEEEEEVPPAPDVGPVPANTESWSPVHGEAAAEDFEGCTGAEEPEHPLEEDQSSGDELSPEADAVPVRAESWSPLTEEAAPGGFEGCTGAEEPEHPLEEELSSEEELSADTADPEKTPETVIQNDKQEEELSSSVDYANSSSFDDGLRRRTGPSFEPFRPKTSDEEDEEEELEFKLAEKKEEKPWFSMSKCIVGALVLLFLGSLFLSGDFDASELSDGEQSQDWLNGDPQDMKVLLDKLTQENQQITQLEAQLQSQKEELDSALKAAAKNGYEQKKADLEKENAKLKEELSFLPELKKELESLRVRVTELNQLKVEHDAAHASSAAQSDGQAGPERSKEAAEGGRLKEELHRQKGLLEESKKRLQEMKRDGSNKKLVRDNLEEIQKKLSEHVDRWEKKKPHDSKWKGNKGKNNGRDHWKKEGKEEKEWKHGKDGGWKVKQNSHKEAWRKDQDEWQRKKNERRMDREDRRKEKPWHSKVGKESEDAHHHHHRQPQQHQQNFWKDQEQKLQRNIRPQPGCSSVEACAAKERLYPVELPEFEELLEGYLSKLQGSPPDSKDKITKLTAGFFEDGVFIHDRCRFSDFAEDVADILEDMADVLEKEDNDSLEEEMEEFEREALWKFSATA
ncbi:pre-B-cell leukemia transcription factor-interacting protein 1 [Gouania willdenowi]|uniref:Pre-B-cell leukemia transcription factor-interacting protein 1-like n=1 Tax=Gouania willdenowi TaxID=441366 RepID=A0A8C5DGC2_GOUWI|nr:pre-B-cell leukemia transcription factor-interacting protein 1-like [Gouania willdenowi]XP_028317293.1 pre-B-cell leukemia transcription factor-interacting protein 1-like [Gouania willdenowi]